MTALQQQYNQLLLDQQKLAETERANRAHESIQQEQAHASTRQAAASEKQAEIAGYKSIIGGQGIVGGMLSLIGTILKAML